jgi:hypothetical protein
MGNDGSNRSQAISSAVRHRESQPAKFTAAAWHHRLSKRNNMKLFSAGLLAAVLAFVPAMAEEIPFATPPYNRSPNESAVGTLANSMVFIQIRHNKLWFAGKARNWDLVDYEAQKLQDDFVTAAGFYRNLPVDNVVQADKPLKRLMEAARTKDPALLDKAFDELTAGCNACHVAGQVGYIRIQQPKSSAFYNQSYRR